MVQICFSFKLIWSKVSSFLANACTIVLFQWKSPHVYLQCLWPQPTFRAAVPTHSFSFWERAFVTHLRLIHDQPVVGHSKSNLTAINHLRHNVSKVNYRLIWNQKIRVPGHTCSFLTMQINVIWIEHAKYMVSI